MKSYVINLARRRDRMAAIAAQLEALRLPYERVDAVDAKSVPDAVIEAHWPPGQRLRAPVHRGAKCCFLSHRLAWQAHLASGEPWAAILEDDARLHPDAARFLSVEDWIPQGVSLVKIELNLLRHRAQLLVGAEIDVSHGYRLAPLLSKHMGAGGYLLSNEGARVLIRNTEVMSHTVDADLFNPAVSNLFPVMQPVQLLPALVAQSTGSGASDLLAWRMQARAERPRGIKGRLMRLAQSYEEMRLLPGWAMAILLGRAHLASVGFGHDGDDMDWAVRSPFR